MTSSRLEFKLFVLGVLLLTVQPAFAATKHRKVVAINDFTSLPNVLKQGEGELLGDALREGLDGLSVDTFQMMTRENITEMLPPQKTLADCYQGQCEVEIGRRLGADYLVLGKVQKVDRQLVASVKLHRIQPVDVLLTRQIRAVTLTDLLNLVRGLGGEVKEALLKSESAPQGGVKPVPPPPVITGPGAVLKFETTPPGAATSVDGKYLCNTPCKWKVTLGSHSVAFQKDGYKPDTKQLESVEEGQTVYLALEAAMGTLSLNATDDRTGDAMVADVYVDGQVVGATPFEGLVPVAAKKIEVAPAGMERRTVYATLMEGRTTKLTLHFQTVAPVGGEAPRPSTTATIPPAPKAQSLTSGKSTSAPLAVEPPKPTAQATTKVEASSMAKYKHGASVSLLFTNPWRGPSGDVSYPVGTGFEALYNISTSLNAKSDVQGRAGLTYSIWNSNATITDTSSYSPPQTYETSRSSYLLDLTIEGLWRYSYNEKMRFSAGLGIGLPLVETASGNGATDAGLHFNIPFGFEYRFTPAWSANVVNVFDIDGNGAGPALQFAVLKIGASYDFRR